MKKPYFDPLQRFLIIRETTTGQFLLINLAFKKLGREIARALKY